MLVASQSVHIGGADAAAQAQAAFTALAELDVAIRDAEQAARDNPDNV
jgi:hypothetical protein